MSSLQLEELHDRSWEYFGRGVCSKCGHESPTIGFCDHGGWSQRTARDQLRWLLEEEGWVSDGADMLCPSCAVAPGLPFALGQPLLLCDGREVRYSGGDNHGSIFAFDRHGQKVIISKEHLVKATAA